MTFICVILGLVGIGLVLFILCWLNAIRGSGSVRRIFDEKTQPAVLGRP